MEESKRILVKMLGHLKSIKALKQNIESLETEKRLNNEAEQELVEVFKVKQKEIEVMTSMASLSKICKYSNALGLITSFNEDGTEDADTLRLKGLKLVDNLKCSLN